MSTPTKYTDRFYTDTMQLGDPTASIIIPHILSLIPAASVVDVGCATGYWLKQFQACGVLTIQGLDGEWMNADLLDISRDAFAVADLSKPLQWPAKYDMAISLEVAEHIAEEHAATFVANVCSLAPVVVFGAAVPHQGGVDHKNERWPSYWASLFAAHGYLPVDALRPLVWKEADPVIYYIQNTVVYATREAIAANAKLSAVGVCTETSCLDMIHPRFYEAEVLARRFEGHPDYMSVKTAWWAMRHTLMNAILRRLRLKPPVAGIAATKR